jgi:hypothetical protein
MEEGITVSVSHADDDLLGLEVFASSPRFAATASLWVALDELGRLADSLEGFPSSASDERSYRLGSSGIGYAGGYVDMFFHTVGGLGRSALDVQIADDDQLHSPAEATFSVQVEAAGVDRFVRALRAIESAKTGSALLSSS